MLMPRRARLLAALPAALVLALALAPAALAGSAFDQVAKTPPATATLQAQTVATHTSSGPPAALVILGALAALLALAALAAVTARALGFEPRWSLEVRHAFAEAGYRTAGVWAEFADWVRFGR